jgi:tryptophan synthase alpha chain
MKVKTTRPLLSIFLTAGYPKLTDLQSQIALLEQYDVDFIEVGIPFSDPLADGPVIQDSSSIALKNGMSLNVIFEQLRSIETSVPLILMGYLNPILQFGIEKFLVETRNAGIDKLVLPDLSMEIYERDYQALFDEYGITPCFLVTPKTKNERIQRAAALSSKGFVYLVSSNSTTGTNNDASEDLQERYKEIKSRCEGTPVIIGFGIRDKASFKEATQHVDGGIIGSAFIQSLKKGNQKEFLRALK